MKDILLHVKGMACSSCECLIKVSLEDIEGIHSVDVDHSTGILKATIDEEKVRIDQIKKAIINEGFKI